jgi:hypothetical protein
MTAISRVLRLDAARYCRFAASIFASGSSGPPDCGRDAANISPVTVVNSSCSTASLDSK